MPDCFKYSTSRAAAQRTSKILTNKIHNELGVVFPGLGCFGYTFSLQVMAADGIRCHQKDSIHTIACPIRGGREAMESRNNSHLGMDETSEWCNSLTLVPKTNGKVEQCLDLTVLNKMLVIPLHRGLTYSANLVRLAGMKYHTLIDSCSDYHDLKLEEKSSFFITFSCPFGRHSNISIPSRAVPVIYMFQKKIDGLFSGMPIVFEIANHILIAGFDKQSKNHDETLDKVLWALDSQM